MRLDWLDDLLAVLDCSSINAASQSRHLTQPAFSRRVKALEHLLGFEIVDRTRKPAQATALLRRNEARIREASANLRALVADLRLENSQGDNQLTIASPHAITASFAPTLVKLLAARGVQVRMRSANRNECFALLLTRQADLAFTYEIPGERRWSGNDLAETLEIQEEQLIPVSAAVEGAPFAADRAPDELPIIAYPADVFLGEVLNGRILPAIDPGINIRPVAVTALTLAALQLSKTGVGLAWTPRSLAAEEIARGALADLSDALPSVTMTLIATRVAERKSQLEEGVWTALKEFIGG